MSKALPLRKSMNINLRIRQSHSLLDPSEYIIISHPSIRFVGSAVEKVLNSGRNCREDVW
jgi:hypothetical protein